ncbi:MAG TPA: nitrate reductase [Deltaproteobacteria bacterium]|nr:nitrate reductase [Candidatus Binatota bacterium]HIL12558.1 nitrate reductase [Deltaproteobacteria bacterium]
MSVRVVCGFCSVGCGLDVHMHDGEATGIVPAIDYPVNKGAACPKGWESLRVLDSEHRATRPLMRGRSGELEPTDWPTAAQAFTRRFKRIQEEHGEDSVAFLSTGQMVTEEMALLGAFARFGMGLVHGDGNTRQCMATSVVAYKQAFGFDAPPYTYGDLEESDVIVMVGANPCIAHPVLWERVLKNPHDPRVVVIDPRKTETAMVATTHLAIKPKSDLVLMYGLARILVKEGWVDSSYIEQHASGFEEMVAHVEEFVPERVAADSGISVKALMDLARTIHEGKRVSFWWTMGVNQSYEGVAVATAIINLALMTGNIGRVGTGANSLTGQCNAMGSRLFSNTTSMFGGRDFSNAEHRREVGEVLGIDAARISARQSLSYDQIVEGIAGGRIKGLWVIGTNPAHSWINQNGLAEILERLDFFVVQDMYHDTTTARHADLLLPAAGWGEKEGTFINSERRIGLVKKVARAPGLALSDFSIFKLLADYWGCAEIFEKWESPEAVFSLLSDLSRGRPCDFSAIEGYRELDQRGGIQWPLTPADGKTEVLKSERRLFEDGSFFHPDGRARFRVSKPRSMPEKPDKGYPLLLLTGRGSAAQWHTQTRTRISAILRRLYPAGAYLEVNPVDARAHGIEHARMIRVESRRGIMRAKAFVTRSVKPGQVFAPMHYEETNRLTDAVFDPESRQPSYKACAVRIRPVDYWEEEPRG